MAQRRRRNGGRRDGGGGRRNGGRGEGGRGQQHGGKDSGRPLTTDPLATPAPDPVTPPGAEQSVFDLMAQRLEDLGLGSLAGKLQELILDGVTDDASLQLALQDTNEWKQRFAGNEKLRKAGQSVLSVNEYLAAERQYAQIMRNYGLPEGFYDDPTDYAGFIGNSISASELQGRVAAWSDLANREDPAVKEQLLSMGLGQGDLLAYMIDPDRAAPIVQKRYQEALVGSAARRSGLGSGSASRLAELGVTEQQAIQGYGLISESLDDMMRLGDIHGTDFSQSDYEGEVFEGDGDAARKRKRLASQERATFGGNSGVGQGSLTRRSSGTY